MYKLALNEYEKALGPDHTLTLGVVNNLGLLYESQSRAEGATKMYERALKGHQKT
jgi:hypothetical protein